MRFNYKACICGAHSQGKTTLVNALKNDLFLDDSHFSFRTNLTRGLKELVPINGEAENYSLTQYLIMARHIEYAKTPGNWLLDRGALDGIAYTSYLYEKDKVSKEVYSAALSVYEQLLKAYDKIFYIVPELELEEDGERSVDKAFFNGVVEKFDFYIRHTSMPADKFVYVMGSVQDRVKIVSDTIRKDFNNEL